MKERDDIDALFDLLGDQLDVETPVEGHKARFLEKLEKQDGNSNTSRTFVIKWWRPLAIAASVVFMIGFVLFTGPQENTSQELASISPEMEQTEDFFTSAIAKEVYALREQQTPETQELVADALEQLSTLEKDYGKMKKDLAKSGGDKRVIHIMITNFQTRIDLLELVMQEMESIKNQNNPNYENTIL